MKRDQVKKDISTARKLGTETSKVEFKMTSGSLPSDMWQEITMFANTKGGVLALGIEDDGTIKGLTKSVLRQHQLKFTQIINDRLSYVVRPDYYPMTMEKKLVLAIYIPEVPNEYKPCFFKDAGLPNGAYVRDGAQKRKITETEMRQMLSGSKEFRYDSLPVGGETVTNLNRSNLLNYLKVRARRAGRAAPKKLNSAQLANAGVLKKVSRTYRPTFGARLVFSKKDPMQGVDYDRFL